jgi:hypothetical protein
MPYFHGNTSYPRPSLSPTCNELPGLAFHLKHKTTLHMDQKKKLGKKREISACSTDLKFQNKPFLA